MNIEMESMPNKENEWNEEGRQSVMGIEMHNEVQQGIETEDFQRMVTQSKRKQIKPESKLEIETITYNAHGRGHKGSFNFRAWFIREIILFIESIQECWVQVYPFCAIAGCVLFIIAVILLPVGITSEPWEERHNENRQELLNNMTDESCYLQNVTQQLNCTYSCNCRKVSCRRRRLRGAKRAMGQGAPPPCKRTVCDECQGVQLEYSGFATGKCGTDQLMYFLDSCIDNNVEMQQRLLQETFTYFVTNGNIFLDYHL